MSKNNSIIVLIVIFSLSLMVLSCNLFKNSETEELRKEIAEMKKEKEDQKNSNTEDANETANKGENANNEDSEPVAKKPVIDNSPKRISFNKGATWGSVNTTLPSNGSQKFIVNAKSGQTIDVDVSSKETSIRIVGGKVEVMGDRGGFLRGNILSNGNITIEVKNTSKKQLKTSVKVTIETPEDEPDLPEHGGDGEDDDGDPPE